MASSRCWVIRLDASIVAKRDTLVPKADNDSRPTFAEMVTSNQPTSGEEEQPIDITVVEAQSESAKVPLLNPTETKPPSSNPTRFQPPAAVNSLLLTSQNKDVSSSSFEQRSQLPISAQHKRTRPQV